MDPSSTGQAGGDSAPAQALGWWQNCQSDQRRRSVLFFWVCRMRWGRNKSAPDPTDATATPLSFAAVIKLIATRLFYMEY